MVWRWCCIVVFVVEMVWMMLLKGLLLFVMMLLCLFFQVPRRLGRRRKGRGKGRGKHQENSTFSSGRSSRTTTTSNNNNNRRNNNSVMLALEWLSPWAVSIDNWVIDWCCFCWLYWRCLWMVLLMMLLWTLLSLLLQVQQCYKCWFVAAAEHVVMPGLPRDPSEVGDGRRWCWHGDGDVVVDAVIVCVLQLQALLRGSSQSRVAQHDMAGIWLDVFKCAYRQRG